MVDSTECYNRALNLLARREHSQQELLLKLLAKGFEEVIAAEVVQQLAEKNLLSDHRFAELYAHSRIQNGYGPIRIQQELQQKGVKPVLAQETLAPYREEWLSHAKRVWQKYVKLHPQAERVKQQRFLYQRGFTSDQINAVMLQGSVLNESEYN